MSGPASSPRSARCSTEPARTVILRRAEGETGPDAQTRSCLDSPALCVEPFPRRRNLSARHEPSDRLRHAPLELTVASPRRLASGGSGFTCHRTCGPGLLPRSAVACAPAGLGVPPKPAVSLSGIRLGGSRRCTLALLRNRRVRVTPFPETLSGLARTMMPRPIGPVSGAVRVIHRPSTEMRKLLRQPHIGPPP